MRTSTRSAAMSSPPRYRLYQLCPIPNQPGHSPVLFKYLTLVARYRNSENARFSDPSGYRAIERSECTGIGASNFEQRSTMWCVGPNGVEDRDVRNINRQNAGVGRPVRIRLRFRKRGRVVECTGLENRQGSNPFVSSNLTASARPASNLLATSPRDANRFDSLARNGPRHAIRPEPVAPSAQSCACDKQDSLVATSPARRPRTGDQCRHAQISRTRTPTAPLSQASTRWGGSDAAIPKPHRRGNVSMEARSQIKSINKHVQARARSVDRFRDGLMSNRGKMRQFLDIAR
jgi:hypothetical protein